MVKLNPNVEPEIPTLLAPVSVPPAIWGLEMEPKLNPAAAAGAETIMNGSRHKAILTQAERTPDAAKDRVFIANREGTVKERLPNLVTVNLGHDLRARQNVPNAQSQILPCRRQNQPMPKVHQGVRFGLALRRNQVIRPLTP